MNTENRTGTRFPKRRVSIADRFAVGSPQSSATEAMSVNGTDPARPPPPRSRQLTGGRCRPADSEEWCSAATANRPVTVLVLSGARLLAYAPPQDAQQSAITAGESTQTGLCRSVQGNCWGCRCWPGAGGESCWVWGTPSDDPSLRN